MAAAAALLRPSTFNLIKSSPFAEKNVFLQGKASQAALTSHAGGGGLFLQVPVWFWNILTRHFPPSGCGEAESCSAVIQLFASPLDLGGNNLIRHTAKKIPLGPSAPRSLGCITKCSNGEGRWHCKLRAG